MPSTIVGKTRNTTADRALGILGLFTTGQPSLPVSSIAEALGTARSTAYRYVQSLVREQYLEAAPDGGYRLGVRILELARVARAGYGISALAIPEMRRLAAEHQQTVLLTKLGGHTIHCLEREEWHGQFVRLSYDPGVELPVNAGASALVLLAWLPEKDVRELLRRPLNKFTANTLVDTDAIVQRLRQIRTDGFALTLAEVDPDALGMAVPIRGPRGQVVAGLSIVALQTRFPPSHRERALRDLLDTSARISARLAVADLSE